jgi:hypothetical protein
MELWEATGLPESPQANDGTITRLNQILKHVRRMPIYLQYIRAVGNVANKSRWGDGRDCTGNPRLAIN